MPAGSETDSVVFWPAAERLASVGRLRSFHQHAPVRVVTDVQLGVVGGHLEGEVTRSAERRLCGGKDEKSATR